jgi:hypothetical protein
MKSGDKSRAKDQCYTEWQQLGNVARIDGVDEYGPLVEVGEN